MGLCGGDSQMGDTRRRTVQAFDCDDKFVSDTERCIGRRLRRRVCCVYRTARAKCKRMDAWLLFPLLRLIPRDVPYDTFEVFLKTVLFLLPMLQIKFIGLLCVSISRHCEMKRQGGERVRGNGKQLAVIAACTAVAAVMCFFIHPLVNFENSDEEFLARSSSPDEAYTLDIYRHNGGATTAFTIKVYSVGRLSRKLIYNAYRESEAEVYWLSDSEVSINGRVLDMAAGETRTLRN